MGTCISTQKSLKSKTFSPQKSPQTISANLKKVIKNQASEIEVRKPKICSSVSDGHLSTNHKVSNAIPNNSENINSSDGSRKLSDQPKNSSSPVCSLAQDYQRESISGFKKDKNLQIEGRCNQKNLDEVQNKITSLSTGYEQKYEKTTDILNQNLQTQQQKNLLKIENPSLLGLQNEPKSGSYLIKSTDPKENPGSKSLNATPEMDSELKRGSGNLVYHQNNPDQICKKLFVKEEYIIVAPSGITSRVPVLSEISGSTIVQKRRSMMDTSPPQANYIRQKIPVFSTKVSRFVERF